MTTGIFYTWQTHDDTEVSATYAVTSSGVEILSVRNGIGDFVELSDGELNDLVLDIEADAHMEDA